MTSDDLALVSCSVSLDGGRIGIGLARLLPIELERVLQLRQQCGWDLVLLEEARRDRARDRRRGVDAMVQNPKVARDTVMERMNRRTDGMGIKTASVPLGERGFYASELAPQFAIVREASELAEILLLTASDWLHNRVAV